MMIIGLTGGIGSGKSTVAKLFSDLGVPIIDTDVIAREVVEPGQPAYESIIQQFGEHILNKDRTLDRATLKKRILDDDNERTVLENILHPIIFDTVKSELALLNTHYCIVVIPLLVENNRYNMLDRILVIDTPVELQATRINQRDKLDPQSIEKLIAIQATREERLKVASDVITNDKGREALQTKVRQLHDKYMNICNKARDSNTSNDNNEY